MGCSNYIDNDGNLKVTIWGMFRIILSFPFIMLSGLINHFFLQLGGFCCNKGLEEYIAASKKAIKEGRI